MPRKLRPDNSTEPEVIIANLTDVRESLDKTRESIRESRRKFSDSDSRQIESLLADIRDSLGRVSRAAKSRYAR